VGNQGIGLLDDGPGFGFLSALQVGVDEEIIRMKLIHPAALVARLGCP
jgi:hypothetical protein